MKKSSTQKRIWGDFCPQKSIHKDRVALCCLRFLGVTQTFPKPVNILEIPRVLFMLSAVSRFQKALTILMLVWWIPASSFCLLESAMLITHTDCCSKSVDSASHSPSDRVESNCCQLASGAYKMAKNEPLLHTAAIAMLSVPAQECVTEPSNFLTADLPGSPPLEWEARWQFILRAAPLSRAPDFA